MEIILYKPTRKIKIKKYWILIRYKNFKKKNLRIKSVNNINCIKVKIKIDIYIYKYI